MLRWLIFNCKTEEKKSLMFLAHLWPSNIAKVIQFQFKLFDTTVTLKYGQGYWKWHELVKLNEYYHHASFDFITFMVSEKIPMLKFSTSPDTSPIKTMLIISLEYAPVAQIILCMFLMHVATIKCLNCSGQESIPKKKKNPRKIHFNTVCNLSFWHTCDLETRSRSSNLNDIIDPKQGYKHGQFERSCFNCVQEKANIKVCIKISKYIISLKYTWNKKKDGMITICSKNLTILEVSS